jgi:hypothetical protein
MNLVKKLALAAALIATVGSAAASPVTQSIGPLNYDHYWYQGWADDNFGQITLSPLTVGISSINGSSYTFDQGWGGYAPCCNAVNLDLYSGSTLLWQDHFAGGNRVGANDPNQSYEVSAEKLTSLNNVLQSIDWSSSPTVSLQLHGDAWAFPGWELHVRNAEFTVSSDVPEPASLALLGLGALGMSVLRRKNKA